jgi:hypothetical protein
MQLHPNFPGKSTDHTVHSLSARYVGLDFKFDVGDLLRADYDSLPQEEKVQWAFAHEMAIGDRVLVFVHHYPFALATVCGEYNYIRTPEPRLGVWFRHFRAVKDIRYFSDFRTNASAWERITMTATITPLRRDDSASQLLIEEWLRE